MGEMRLFILKYKLTVGEMRLIIWKYRLTVIWDKSDCSYENTELLLEKLACSFEMSNEIEKYRVHKYGRNDIAHMKKQSQ